MLTRAEGRRHDQRQANVKPGSQSNRKCWKVSHESIKQSGDECTSKSGLIDAWLLWIQVSAMADEVETGGRRSGEDGKSTAAGATLINNKAKAIYPVRQFDVNLRLMLYPYT